MDPLRIDSRFNCIEVIPGNGYSPYTGSVVFRCYDNYLETKVTVKASAGVKNNHKTIKQEYDFIRNLKHPSVIEVLEYGFKNNIEFMIMKGADFIGGRRERWRDIFLLFDEGNALDFFNLFIDVLFYLQENNVLHEDIECANLVYDSHKAMPILIDFGRAQYKEYSKEWLIEQLRIDRKTKQNAFFREVTNTGGVYANEPPLFRFDVENIIEEILNRRGLKWISTF